MRRGVMSSENLGDPARVATDRDLDGLTATLWAAFADDPLWRWAFPDHSKLEAWWRFLIESALRYPWVWVTGKFAAASVWIPPGGTELTDEDEARVEPLLTELVGPRAPAVIDLLERFEASHPRTEPHYYLSLLGTHPEHRGRGLGMGLLAENLSTIDAEGLPAYLESSNPQNDRRYERLGFVKVGAFATPDDAHSVSTMWREPR
jgi:GNAT superfamily N-acetyltransferase